MYFSHLNWESCYIWILYCCEKLSYPSYYTIYLPLYSDFQGEERTANIRFLPPIVLRFELPLSYPAESAPTFKLNCKWLSPAQVINIHNIHAWAETRYNLKTTL